MKRFITISMSLACLMAWSVDATAADGDPDPTFSGDGLASATWPYEIFIPVIAVAADGSIFHATTEHRQSSGEVNRDFAVTKFRPNGVLDGTFGFAGQRTVAFDIVPNGDDALKGVFPEPDGGVFLAGKVDLDPEPFSYAAPALARLTAAGNVDTTFGDNGRVVIAATPWMLNDFLKFSNALRQADGKFVFVGFCRDCEADRLGVAVRLTAAGEIDPTFGEAGWATFDVESSVEVTAAAIDGLGRIVLAGSQVLDGENRLPWLARLTPTGSLDVSFGGGTGISFLSQVPPINNWLVRDITINRDSSILLALGSGAGAIVRANANGSLDTAFADGGFRNLEREQGSDITAVTIRSDDRILFAGFIFPNGGGIDHYIGRLLPDGSLDTSFDGNGVIRIDMTPGEFDAAWAIALSAGRPVIAGRGGNDKKIATVVRMESNLIFTDTFED